MEEVKDIVLKKGDKLTLCYYDGQSETFIIDNDDINRIEVDAPKIKYYKIERPIKYETIYEAPKQILDREEKEWLEHFLRPFRNEISWIVKHESCGDNEYIAIKVKGKRCFEFPDFKKDTMYKGMELDKEYTLEELGLFKGE